MSIFAPTYLYIKQHSITKKLYFGKTTRSGQELLEYKGSGSYWDKHITKHGRKYVETLWYCLFLDKDDCEEFAKLCSEQWNIVESSDWANLTIEDGYAGIPKGTKIGPPSDESRLKNSLAHKGRPAHNKGVPQTSESNEKRRQSCMGKNKGKKYGPQTPELVKKRMDAMAANRLPISDSEKRDIAQRFLNGETYNQIRTIHKFGTGKIAEILVEQNINPKIRTCPHCGITACSANIGKYHLDNCKVRK